LHLVLLFPCKFAVRGLGVNGETAPVNVFVGFKVDMPAVHRGRRGDYFASVGVIDTIAVIDGTNFITCPLVGVAIPLFLKIRLFLSAYVNDIKDSNCLSGLFPHLLRGETKVSSSHCATPLRVMVQPRDLRLVTAVDTEGVPVPVS